MDTTDLVAGLREYVEAVGGLNEIAYVPTDGLADKHKQIRSRYVVTDYWIETHASAIADEMERLKRKADAFDLFMSCVDAVKDAEPSDVVNALLDKVKENSRLRESLAHLVATLEAHEVSSLSCDRDGNTYCYCVHEETAKARKALDAKGGE